MDKSKRKSKSDQIKLITISLLVLLIAWKLSGMFADITQSSTLQELKQDFNHPNCIESSCWQGLHPNITSTEETQIILENLDVGLLVLDDSKNIKGIWAYSFEFRVNDPIYKAGFINVVSGKIRQLSLSIKDICLSDILAIWGNPDSVYHTGQGKNSRYILYYDDIRTIMDLSGDKRAYMIHMLDSSYGDFSIMPTDLLSSDEIQEFVNSKCSYSLFNVYSRR